MKTNPLKLLGTGMIILGALMLIVACLPFASNLLETPFNIYILLALLLCIGGLFTHILTNKRLPLDEIEEEESPTFEYNNVSENTVVANPEPEVKEDPERTITVNPRNKAKK